MKLNNFNEDVLQDYVNKICHRSRIATDAIKTYLADKEKGGTTEQEFGAIAYSEVLLEFVTFFLHFTDRCLFWEAAEGINIDFESRDYIMDCLVENSINSAADFCFFGLQECAKNEYKKSSFKIHNIRMEEYSKYKKNFAEEDEGYKDTLFWEFSKNISKFINREYDTSFKLMCLKMTINAIKDLNPKSFIKNLMQ